ncbi:MAG: glycosyltransferase family 4 protein [Chloroflexi bacterium]|nr:glycosyltransferase family 4 protein [Chloroflexota bacterium]
MNNKFRLVVVEPNGSGGLIHYAYQQCYGLAEEGVDVTLVTGREYELKDLPHNFRVNNMLDLWPLFEQKSEQNINANYLKRTWGKIRWNLRRVGRAMRLVRAWISLTRYLTKTRPDIVQFSKINFPFEIFFLSQLRRRGLHLSQICHEFELRESRSSLSSLFLNAYADAYNHFSVMFFHARENRDRFHSIFPHISTEKTFLIPHGNSGWLLRNPTRPEDVDALRKKYGFQKDDRVVLFFGLLAPSKGLDDLIDAFALARKLCDAKLVIAGYPTKHVDVGELRSRIAASNLTEDVILDTRYIPVNELGALMGLATVVVYPYRSSTQSGALQVAYTFGRPVIATAIGGLPEVVEDGKSGLLTPVQSPEKLAENIVTVVNDQESAARMGAYARHLSETRFSWRTVAKQMVEVYGRFLNSRTG